MAEDYRIWRVTANIEATTVVARTADEAIDFIRDHFEYFVFDWQAVPMKEEEGAAV